MVDSPETPGDVSRRPYNVVQFFSRFDYLEGGKLRVLAFRQEAIEPILAWISRARRHTAYDWRSSRLPM